MRSLIWFKIQSCRKLTQTSMESCGEVTLNSMLTKEGSMELRQNIMLSCGIPWKSGYVSTIPIKCQIISSKSHFLYPTWASMEIRWSAGSAVLCDSFQEQRRNVQSQQLRSDLWQSEVRHWVLLRSKNIHIHLIDMQPICISHIYIYVYTCIYICISHHMYIWTYILKYMSRWIMSWAFYLDFHLLRLQPDQITPSDSLSVPWIWSPPWWRSYRSFRRKAVAVSGFANQHRSLCS